MVFNGGLEDAIHDMLLDSIISPVDNSRKIDNFIFEESEDPVISGLTISAQYCGDNLLDVIKGLCEANDIGFKVTLNASKQFVFKLYNGVDRSYDQDVEAYVEFSPTFGNLITSDYTEDMTNYKNVVLVGGEGEGSDKIFASVGDAQGLDRREVYEDAGGISSTTEDGQLPEGGYISQLEQKGELALAEAKITESFESEIDATNTPKYGVDFFLGDILQTQNEYELGGKVRASEIIYSCDGSGINIHPTFVPVL